MLSDNMQYYIGGRPCDKYSTVEGSKNEVGRLVNACTIKKKISKIIIMDWSV